ncbi:MAG: 50S ribosomal protein L6 [Eubacteriales bacterium]|nr:50S ribosomal protein L6 [Eubacteriales bacterium]
MSRIGRLPVAIPAGVEIKVSPENVVEVKGPKGVLTLSVNKNIKVEVEGNVLHVKRPNDEQENKAMHGLYRKLIANMVEGVTNGYKKGLVINGVGYKVAKQGNKIVMDVGYSHTVEVVEPDGIKFECPSQTEIVVSGIDKVKVGQVAANIRAIRVPDPYHAYGVRYSDEVIARKEGKKAGK